MNERIRRGTLKTSANVERLKAVCSMEAPTYDEELIELMSHVARSTKGPPRLIVRLAAFRRKYRFLHKRLRALLRTRR